MTAVYNALRDMFENYFCNVLNSYAAIMISNYDKDIH